jgi:hypothetical protein
MSEYESLKRAVDRSNQTAYLPPEAKLAQTRWFGAMARMFHQPESATGVAFQWKGTPSGPASTGRLREEEE